jgi:hypothetical protein
MGVSCPPSDPGSAEPMLGEIKTACRVDPLKAQHCRQFPDNKVIPELGGRPKTGSRLLTPSDARRCRFLLPADLAGLGGNGDAEESCCVL